MHTPFIRSFYRAIHLLIVILLILAPSAGLASRPSQGETSPPAIYLKMATFNPGLGQLPAAPTGLSIDEYAQNQRGYYIIQFRGPVQQAWKDQLLAFGAEVLDYIPDYAFKARLTPEQAAAVAQLSEVNWVGIFQPAYKLSPDLERDGTRLYRLRVERGADMNQAAAEIIRSGAQVLNQDGDYLLIAADGAQLDSIANVLDVAWVENFIFYEKHNEYGAGVIMGANVANANGYDGSTQIAAVADTGLGGGTAATAHADIPASRIAAIQSFSAANSSGCYNIIANGAQDVDSGHGTHVAVSVVGDGGPSGEGQGSAPAAGLVFQAVEEYVDFVSFCSFLYADGYYLIGIPTSLASLFQPAYNAGARIHSNSWGSAAAGDYTADSASADSFIWNNRDFLITFSAGNEGADANNNGVVDNDSIGSPATAKNVLTVGASEGDRQGNYPCDNGLTYTSLDAYQSGQTCGSMGGNQINFLGTAGARWGFTTEPLNSDETAGNAAQMAPFSSRGPTDDGRIKPDVVAPGTWVLSGYSGLYQQGYGDPTNPQNGLYQVDGWGMPRNVNYKYFGGTSMSNPLTAGAATVVRDFYQKTAGYNASAALVKATLINSAVDLLDENNDGANDNDYPIPNVHEGWGRVNLINATDGSHQYVDNTGGITTGGSATQPYNLSAAGAFKVTLVWSDYPSTETAAQNLVNDLDLIVTAPGGTVYRGNVFSGGWSQSGGSADRVNNVENVYVQSAAAGAWTVQVSGFNVPNGPQPFALVVDGSFGAGGDNPPTVSITNPADGATVSGSVTVSANASDDNGVSQVEFFLDGASLGVDTTAPYAVNWDTTTAANGGHTLSATATDTASQTGSHSINVTVDNQGPDNPPTVSITNPADGATVSGSVTVSANAGDDNGVTQVEFFLDGASLGVDTTAPYAVNWDTTTAANGGHTLSATATDTASQTGSHSINVTVDNAAPGGDVVYVSSTSNGNAGGVAFNDEDIVAYDRGSGAWSLYFDGSDVGLTSSALDTDAFQLMADGSILLSFTGAASVAGLGTVDDSDLVRFVPTSLGNNTAGTFEWYFDGSDVGLTTNNEDIDAISLLANGDLILSTIGGFSVSGASGTDEDLIRFVPGSLGANTGGAWSLYFDGSDVGLNTASSEDVNGAWVDGASGDVYLSTVGSFSVSGSSGDGSDIFICHPASLGSTTACSFGPGLYWDGSANGFAGEVTDGFSVEIAGAGSSASNETADSNWLFLPLTER